MRKQAFTVLIACLFAACGGTKSSATTTTTGGTTSSTSSTSSGTTGVATSSGTSGGTTGASGTTSGALPSCGTNLVWSGSTCLLAACLIDAGVNAACALGDGGQGRCANGKCYDFANDPSNCSLPGVTCTAGASCQDGVCLYSDGGLMCANLTACSAGSLCDYFGCETVACGAGSDGDACSDGGFSGSCCNGTCIGSDDANNCGACGNVCPSGTQCLSGSCVATCGVSNSNQSCSAGGENGFCCGGTCDTTQNDPLNCGSCGRACPANDTCLDSYYCQPPASGPVGNCPAGLTLVGSGCSGSYECACLPETCVVGEEGLACAIAGTPAVQGSCCGDVCVDFSNDPQNCGGCNLICPSGTACLAGACGQVVTGCANQANGASCNVSPGVSGTCCSGTCVASGTDNNNCGACGNICPTEFPCGGGDGGYPGTCLYGCGNGYDCPAGSTCVAGLNACYTNDCSGKFDSTPCANASGQGICCGGSCVPSDSSNCGACGETCPSSASCYYGEACVNSGHTYSCSYPGDPPCAAGSVCANQICLSPSCTGASNGDRCAAGPGLEGTCCSGTCVSTLTDTANCGACGLTCAGVCSGGHCSADQPNTCVQTCGTGQLCVDGSCVGSLCNGSAAGCVDRDGGAGTCCPGGACADLLSDAQNCGACGIVCSSGSCSDGHCSGAVCGATNQNQFCKTGVLTSICCGDVCADTATDPQNCGACGTTCASGTCTSGICS